MNDPAVDLLQRSGATRITYNTRNQFRTGFFPNGATVQIAYYSGFGGWQVEFDRTSRSARVQELRRAGFTSAYDAPRDNGTRVALGHDPNVMLAVIRYLVGQASPPPPPPPPPVPPPPLPKLPAWDAADVARMAGFYSAEECAELAARGCRAAQVRSLIGL